MDIALLAAIKIACKSDHELQDHTNTEAPVRGSGGLQDVLHQHAEAEADQAADGLVGLSLPYVGVDMVPGRQHSR